MNMTRQALAMTVLTTCFLGSGLAWAQERPGSGRQAIEGAVMFLKELGVIPRVQALQAGKRVVVDPGDSNVSLPPVILEEVIRFITNPSPRPTMRQVGAMAALLRGVVHTVAPYRQVYPPARTAEGMLEHGICTDVALTALPEFMRIYQPNLEMPQGWEEELGIVIVDLKPNGQLQILKDGGQAHHVDAVTFTSVAFAAAAGPMGTQQWLKTLLRFKSRVPVDKWVGALATEISKRHPGCQPQRVAQAMAGGTSSLVTTLSQCMGQPQAQRRPAPPPAAEPRIPQLMLFTSPGCHACQRVMRYLEKRGVPFQEVRVETTDGNVAFERILSKNGQSTRSVPILALGDRILARGYDPGAIERALSRLSAGRKPNSDRW